MCVRLRRFVAGVFVPYYKPIVGVTDRLEAECQKLASLRWSRNFGSRLSDQ